MKGTIGLRCTCIKGKFHDVHRASYVYLFFKLSLKKKLGRGIWGPDCFFKPQFPLSYQLTIEDTDINI